MYTLDASRYHEAVMILQQVIDLSDGRQRPPQLERMSLANINSTLEMLTRFAEVIRPLHVPVTGQTGADLLLTLAEGGLNYLQCGNLLLNLSHTLRRELQTAKIYVLDPQNAEFYEPRESLFGPEVLRKFPSVSYDIEQGGKCYACELTTAAAFHWIRTMEAGVRAIARCLGIPDPTKGRDRNWSNISRSINDEIERRWPKSTGRMSGDSQLFDKLYGAISGMQNPYRNETMHLEAKYTAPEALHIFELVKGFMQRVASRMDEDGGPKV